MNYKISNSNYFVIVVLSQILSVLVVAYSGFTSDNARGILLILLLAISAYSAIKISSSRIMSVSMLLLWLAQLLFQYKYAPSFSLWLEKLIFEYKHDSILLLPTTNFNPNILFDCILIPGTLSVLLQFILTLIMLILSLLIQKKIKTKLASVFVMAVILLFSLILVQPSYVVKVESSAGCSTAIGEICMSSCTHKGLKFFGIKTGYIIGVSCSHT